MDIEHRGVIEDTVKGAEQGVFFMKIFSPQGRTLVAGEDNVVSPFLVILLMIATQIMRLPDSLSEYEQLILNNIHVDRNYAKNIAHVSSLPFDDRFWDTDGIPSHLVQQFDDCCFTVGVYPKNDIMTSDVPIAMYSAENTPSMVFYPISSKVCIILRKRCYCPTIQKNALVRLTDRDVDKINVSISIHAAWLYYHENIDTQRLAYVLKYKHEHMMINNNKNQSNTNIDQ